MNMPFPNGCLSFPSKHRMLSTLFSALLALTITAFPQFNSTAMNCTESPGICEVGWYCADCGLCEPYRQLNDVCCAKTPCAPEYICDTSIYRCTAKKGENDACKTNDQCNTALRCLPKSDSDGEKTCQCLKQKDDRCKSPSECSLGLLCTDDKCMPPDEVTYLKQLGDSCDVKDEIPGCGEGLRCSGSKGKCVRLEYANATCTESYQCQDWLHCDSKSETCQLPKSKNQD